MINKVILLGNLGKDPELRRLDSGVSVARFPMATNENYKDRNDEWQTKTEWHNVVAWRALADRAERSLKKGMLVYLEGKLTTKKYTDKEGVEKYSTDVVANMIRIIDRKEHSGGPGNYDSAGNSAQDSTSSNTADEPEVEKSDDDDLPF